MYRWCLPAVAVVFLFTATPSLNGATPPCVFSFSGMVMTLTGDCTTDVPIQVPDGYTLDGNGFTITAVDPAGDHFKGAVVMNAGTTASVIGLTITTGSLSNVCDGGVDRLRGIMFEGASGAIIGNTVLNINQGPSGCQEGNAVEIRNSPYDGTHPGTVKVEVGHNLIQAWQKTGIVANGDVDVWVHHNVIGQSATQANLAANSLQIGFGGKGLVEHNHIAQNSWLGTSDWVATGILLYSSAPGTVVRQNNLMEGNADVGIYISADGATVDNNKVFESGPDATHGDVGIGNYGTGNIITNNKVRGYDVPYDGVTGGKNKAIPKPHILP